MASEDSDFPRVFRGYDTEAVDRSLLRMRRELLTTKSEVDRLTILASELAEARQKIQFAEEQSGTPSYAAFGFAFESILHDAEEFARMLTSRAQADAVNAKNAIERERTALLSHAQTEAQNLISLAQSRAREIVTVAENNATEIISHATTAADKLLDEANLEVANARRASATEISRARTSAKREIEKRHSAAERELAELKLVLTRNAAETASIDSDIINILRIDADAAAHRDQAAADYLAKHQEAVHATALYLEQAQNELATMKQQVGANRALAERTVEQARAYAQKVSEAVDVRALSLLAAASTEAQRLVDEAQRLSTTLKTEAQTQARDTMTATEYERDQLREILSKMRHSIASTTLKTTAKSSSKKRPPVPRQASPK